MPYIDKEDRDQLDNTINRLISIMSLRIRKEAGSNYKGVNNYVCTRLILGTLLNTKTVGYTSLSDAKAICSDMHDEIHDRCLRPYEDQKIKDNGDVKEFVEVGMRHILSNPTSDNRSNKYWISTDGLFPDRTPEEDVDDEDGFVSWYYGYYSRRNSD